MNTWSCSKSEVKIPQPRSAHGVLTKILIYLAMQLLKVEDCKMICKEFKQSWDTKTHQCPHRDYSWIATGCAPIKTAVFILWLLRRYTVIYSSFPICQLRLLQKHPHNFLFSQFWCKLQLIIAGSLTNRRDHR